MFIRILAILCCLAMSLASPAFAQTMSDGDVARVIAKVKEAYGGDRLERLKSLTIESDRRLGWPGQGQTAQYVDYVPDRFIRHFDLKNQYGSVERWNFQNGNIYHNRYIFDENGAQTVDYIEGVYTEQADQTYAGFFSSDYRMSDLLLAHLLVTRPLEITHAGVSFYNGFENDVLRFQITADTPEIQIYIDKGKGLISRLQLEYGTDMATIVYADHKEKKGFSYASANRTFLGDTLVEYSQSLSINPNKSVSRDIRREASLTPDREQFDLTEMTIDEVGPGAFHVGLDDYSFFIEHEGGYILVNPYAGLEARYEALSEYRNQRLPIQHVISTHHHDERLADISFALSQGARLHITPETEKVMRQKETLPAEGRYEILADGGNLGPLTIYVKPTQQAVENAFIYHRDAKILYQDDHYNGLYKDGPTWVRPTGVQLFQLIESLSLDVDFILASHARKAEPWSTFKEGVARTLIDDKCPSGRQICSQF